MAGKRTSEDTGATTRSAKAAKTDTAAAPAPAKGKRGGTRKTTKPVLPATAFKAKAKPLHIHVSHMAPAAAAEGEAVSGDVAGQVAYFALTPSSFATGSYGWKGSKRATIELPNGEGEEKEKVTVMLSFNATVVGSKGAKEGDEEEIKVDEAEGGEGKTEEHAEGAEGEHTAEGGAETTVEAAAAAVAAE